MAGRALRRLSIWRDAFARFRAKVRRFRKATRWLIKPARHVRHISRALTLSALWPSSHYSEARRPSDKLRCLVRHRPTPQEGVGRMFGFKTNSSKNSGLAFFLIAVFAGGVVVWLAPHRRALKLLKRVAAASAPDTDAEKARNAQCARDVCSIVLSKEANGSDVSCELAHRWQAKEIDKAGRGEGRLMGHGAGAVHPQDQANSPTSSPPSRPLKIL